MRQSLKSQLRERTIQSEALCTSWSVPASFRVPFRLVLVTDSLGIVSWWLPLILFFFFCKENRGAMVVSRASGVESARGLFWTKLAIRRWPIIQPGRSHLSKLLVPVVDCPLASWLPLLFNCLVVVFLFFQIAFIMCTVFPSHSSHLQCPLSRLECVASITPTSKWKQRDLY